MDTIHREKLPSFGKIELLARQVVEGFITGLHKSPFHGFSVEFAEHRLYNTGESTRHIDWKLYARTEKLFVKRYEEETNLRCQLVIDHSPSMYFPVDAADGLNKMKFAAFASASLIELLKRQRDAVGLSLFAGNLHYHSNAKSSTVHHKMLWHKLEELIDKYKPGTTGQTNVAEALHHIAEQVHRRSLVVVFSDMLDNTQNEEQIFSALQHLKHNKHEVVLFHVTDRRHEMQLEYGNRPHTFIDMETGERIKINPNQIKDSYKEAMDKWWQKLKLRCGQFRVDLVEADIAQGYHQVLLQYLIKRQKML